MSSDNQLQQAVLAELKWEPSITAAHIGVVANAGVVTLTGHVGSFVERHAAEKATGKVKGVKAVVQDIEVRLPFDKKRNDDEIATAAVERLEWDDTIPDELIRIKVEKGWVTLTGEVEWHYQQEAAENSMRRLSGVIGVTNLITVKPKIDTANISDNIMQAMDRLWFFRAENRQGDSKRRRNTSDRYCTFVARLAGGFGNGMGSPWCNRRAERYYD